MLKLAFNVPLVGLAALLFSPSAMAYLDPGSGSLLLQVLLGGIAGLAVAGKMFWWQILSFFGINKGQDDADSGSDGGHGGDGSAGQDDSTDS